MTNKTLADLTPEERKEALNYLDKVSVDRMFIDLFCEMFNVILDYRIGCIDSVIGEGVPNEKEN